MSVKDDIYIYSLLIRSILSSFSKRNETVIPDNVS